MSGQWAGLSCHHQDHQDFSPYSAAMIYMWVFNMEEMRQKKQASDFSSDVAAPADPQMRDCDLLYWTRCSMHVVIFRFLMIAPGTHWHDDGFHRLWLFFSCHLKAAEVEF